MKRTHRALRLAALLLILLLTGLPAAALADDAAVAEAPVILEAYSLRGIVTVRTASAAPLADYALTAILREPDADAPDWIPNTAAEFSVFKMDGAYEIWVRDANGAVSAPYHIEVDSGYNYVYSAKGLKHLSQPLDEYLAARGYSLDALNRYIAENTADAGMYTRSGVAAAAVSLSTKMADYGATVPWVGRSNYTQREDWGALADWGGLSKTTVRAGESESSRKLHRGLHCNALLMWAYKQAGLNPVSETNYGLYFLGAREKLHDNKIPLDRGQCGDLFKTTTTHNMMILDKVDTDLDGRFDSYLVLEMISPDLTINLYTLRQLKNYTCYDMSAFFDDTALYTQRARYWPGTYRIPASDWPDYLQTAVATSDARRALLRLQSGLGLGG